MDRSSWTYFWINEDFFYRKIITLNLSNDSKKLGDAFMWKSRKINSSDE